LQNIYLASWLAFMSVLILIIGFNLLKRESKIRKLLKNEMTNEVSWQDTAKKIGPFITLWIPIFNLSQLKENLDWAGKPYGLNEEGFIGSKILLSAIGLFVGVFFTTLDIPIIIAFLLAFLLYFLPDALLRGAIEKRQKQIYKDLPNMVGLLSMSISAGVEIGSALEAISRKFPGPLGDEMRQAWREIATGKPRASALRAMANRTGVISVKRFFETIIIAEERGGGDLSLAIETYKKELIESQSRKMQEEARKIPTKMLLPIMLCIFIPMIMLMLVPVMVSLIQSL